MKRLTICLIELYYSKFTVSSFEAPWSMEVLHIHISGVGSQTVEVQKRACEIAQGELVYIDDSHTNVLN
jgi:hypothetical protein